MAPAHHIATALWLCVAGNICSFSSMGVNFTPIKFLWVTFWINPKMSHTDELFSNRFFHEDTGINYRFICLAL